MKIILIELILYFWIVAKCHVNMFHSLKHCLKPNGLKYKTISIDNLNKSVN